MEKDLNYRIICNSNVSEASDVISSEKQEVLLLGNRESGQMLRRQFGAPGCSATVDQTQVRQEVEHR